jgi:hypothetical protein
MLDDKKKLTVNGVDYPIEFSLNVMALVQEKYGSLDNWSEIIDSKDKEKEPSIKDIIWTFTAMINEGIESENETSNTQRALLTEKQVGRLVTQFGLNQSMTAIKGIVTGSTQGDEKNLTTTPNQTEQQ